MKEIAIPSRLNTLVASLLDVLVEPDEPATKTSADASPVIAFHERPARKEYFYYTQLIDARTNEVVGHLSDIGTGGFKLDSLQPLPINKDIRFRLNLTKDVTEKPFMEFVARSRWCQVDPLDPNVYNVGYQLIKITPGDLEIFNRIMEKHGRDYDKKTVNLRNSNKW